MTDTLPPRPDGPSELDALRKVVDLANEAVAHASYSGTSQAFSGMRAERAFYQSWQAMVRHMLTETLETENRALAWDRVEELEAKLEEIRFMVTVITAPDFLSARIREVLDR